MLAGVIYGSFYYRKPLSLGRVFAAHLVVSLVCNVLLNTLCLSLLYGKAFMVLLPPRVIKNLIMWPIDSPDLLSYCKAPGSSRNIQVPGRKGSEPFIKGGAAMKLNTGMRCHDLCEKWRWKRCSSWQRKMECTRSSFAFAKSISNYDFTTGHYNPGFARYIKEQLDKTRDPCGCSRLLY